MGKLKSYTALHRIHRESGEIINKGEVIKLDPSSPGVPLLIKAGRIKEIKSKPKAAEQAAGQE